MDHPYFCHTDWSRWMFPRWKLIKHKRVPLSSICRSFQKQRSILDFFQLVPEIENLALYDSQDIISTLAKSVEPSYVWDRHFSNHSSLKKKGSLKRHSIQCDDARCKRIDLKNHQTSACVKLSTLSAPDLIQFLPDKI